MNPITILITSLLATSLAAPLVPRENALEDAVAQSIGNDIKAAKKPFNYNFNYEPFKYKNFKYNGDFNYRKPKQDDGTTASSEAEAAPITARDEEAVAEAADGEVKAAKKPFNYNFNYEPFKYKNFKYNGDFNYRKPKPEDGAAVQGTEAPIQKREEAGEVAAQEAGDQVQAAKKPFNYNFNYEPFKYKNFKYNGDFNYRKPKPEDGAAAQSNEASEAPVQKREEAGEVVAQEEDANAAKAKPFNYGFNYEPFKYKNFKYEGNFNYKKPKPEDGTATEEVKEAEEKTA
ncbi:hypothetical protein BZA77DRAFT_376278 [Pyronema omphalodes]|nr:hypothetical protein BZA77DRAFT_376278 [Pyronema omphalodes]